MSPNQDIPDHVKEEAEAIKRIDEQEAHIVYPPARETTPEERAAATAAAQRIIDRLPWEKHRPQKGAFGSPRTKTTKHHSQYR